MRCACAFVSYIRDVISIECGTHLTPPQNWFGLLFDRFMRKLTFALYLEYARYVAFRQLHGKISSCQIFSFPFAYSTAVYICVDACMCVTSYTAYCTHWTRKNMKIKISYHKTIRAHSLVAYSTNGKITTRCFAEYICRLCSHIFYWTSCYYCLLPSPLLRLRLPQLAMPGEHQTSNNTMVEVTPG